MLIDCELLLTFHKSFSFPRPFTREIAQFDVKLTFCNVTRKRNGIISLFEHDFLLHCSSLFSLDFDHLHFFISFIEDAMMRDNENLAKTTCRSYKRRPPHSPTTARISSGTLLVKYSRIRFALFVFINFFRIVSHICSEAVRTLACYGWSCCFKNTTRMWYLHFFLLLVNCINYLRSNLGPHLARNQNGGGGGGEVRGMEIFDKICTPFLWFLCSLFRVI